MCQRKANTMHSAQFPKRCTCCGTFLYPYDWDLLPLLQREGVPPRTDLEMRNCTCGTTLAVALEVAP